MKYNDSVNSEVVHDSVTSESSASFKKFRKFKHKAGGVKSKHIRKLSCGSVSLPMSSMLAILDSLKEIEEEMDK